MTAVFFYFTFDYVRALCCTSQDKLREKILGADPAARSSPLRAGVAGRERPGGAAGTGDASKGVSEVDEPQAHEGR